jgi:large subunit ribosomal protein L18
MTVNYITSKNAQDKVEISVNSKKLLKYGWPKEWIGSLRSTPACYLLGYVAGKEIVSKYKEKVILDLGLMRTIPKSRVYAILKGLVDAGVKINCNKKVFPSEERIKGQHMKKDVEEILNKVKLAIGGKDE